MYALCRPSKSKSNLIVSMRGLDLVYNNKERKHSLNSWLQLPLDWVWSSKFQPRIVLEIYMKMLYKSQNQLHDFFSRERKRSLGCSRNAFFVKSKYSFQWSDEIVRLRPWIQSIMQSEFVLFDQKMSIRYTLHVVYFFAHCQCEGQSLSGVHGTVYAMQQAFNEVAPNICVVYAPIECVCNLINMFEFTHSVSINSISLSVALSLEIVFEWRHWNRIHMAMALPTI